MTMFVMTYSFQFRWILHSLRPFFSYRCKHTCQIFVLEVLVIELSSFRRGPLGEVGRYEVLRNLANKKCNTQLVFTSTQSRIVNCVNVESIFSLVFAPLSLRHRY